ncbi:MAG: undecaprenyldiphospho-muramoylpentapeptide beta-N-acetylglucosaminyltransferase [Actinomycetota bacterium]|nr:undecaprenyldiphospho-muramoylpentapeptide beta-N-acetylglucosaminyltransferase [Actinomycetota bacterium]
MRKKILICGGGTGGHLYPAMAIIEYIKDNYPLCELFFIGSDKGLGKELIPAFNINYKNIKSSGLILSGNIFRKFLNIVKFLYWFTSGFFQSLKIVLRFKPDIILGMGGYICAPVLAAGIFNFKKIALHEQNYIPGRLNKLFSRFSKYIFISFEDTARYFKVKKGRVVFTGNPLRKAIRQSGKIKSEFKKWGLEEGRFTVVAFGGSLGAEKINNTVMDLYNHFRNKDEIQILLICGSRFYGKLVGSKNKFFKSRDKLVLNIFPYIHEMQEIYRISDLIISRAGANTVSELIEYNIPSILVPYPDAVANHQFYNAVFLAKRGKAILIEDRDLDSGKIAEVIESLMRDNHKKYKNMKNIEIKDRYINSAQIITSKLMEN